MLKKNVKKPDKADFSSLDAAVSELSKQTAALLGETGEKAATSTKKPSLPKKHHTHAKKGKSFDIIHHPKQKTSLVASLKTTQPAEAITKQPDVPKLPENASESYNEKTNTTSDKPLPQLVVTPIVRKNSAPPVIQHHTGTLNIGKNQMAETDKVTKIPLPNEANKEEKATTVSRTSVVFESKKAETQSEEKDKSQVSDNKEIDSTPKEEAPATENTQSEVKQDEPAPLPKKEESADLPKKESDGILNLHDNDTGEVFANNLLDKTVKKGYKPHDGQQKPTVFDTNEYYPELHDWSKLGKRQSSKWLLLILLLVVAAGLAYLFISGQAFSFVTF